jgi:hypothetical protein
VVKNKIAKTKTQPLLPFQLLFRDQKIIRVNGTEYLVDKVKGNDLTVYSLNMKESKLSK